MMTSIGLRAAVVTALTGALALTPTGLPGAVAVRVEGCAEGCRTEAVDTVTVGMGLEEVVRTALDRSRRIRAARYALEEADERVSEAWGNLYPRLDWSASYTRNLSPPVNFVPARFFDPEAPADDFVPLQFGADNQWSTTVSAEQILFDPAAFVGVGAAGRFEGLQREVLRGEVQAVATSVQTLFFGLLLAQEQTRLTENSVRRLEETLEETRALERAGLASEFDVLRLEVEVANLQPTLLRTRNAVRERRRDLAVALDLEDEEGLAVAGSLATMDIEDPAGNSAANREILEFVGRGGGEEVEELVARARAARSDVRQLELTASLRGTELRLAQVEYLPELSLFGGYTITASENGDPDFFGPPRAYGRQVGVQFTLPIFHGLQRDARIDQRRAVARAAETEASLARDRAESEVRTLVDRLGEARASARAQGLAVEQAGRGFEIARAQLREGIGSRLELTDAEVALRQSEFNYAQAIHDFLVARARLDEATGQVSLADDVPSHR